MTPGKFRIKQHKRLEGSSVAEHIRGNSKTIFTEMITKDLQSLFYSVNDNRSPRWRENTLEFIRAEVISIGYAVIPDG